MINITQSAAIDAYYAFEDIYKQKMKPEIALDIFRLRQHLKKQYEFQIERERQIIEDYCGQRNAEGNIVFPDEEKYNGAQAELKELADSIISVDAKPINLLKENILISPENINQIIPFIIL